MSCCDGDESEGCYCGNKAFERFLESLPKNRPRENPYWDNTKIQMLKTCFYALSMVDTNKVKQIDIEKEKSEDIKG